MHHDLINDWDDVILDCQCNYHRHSRKRNYRINSNKSCVQLIHDELTYVFVDNENNRSNRQMMMMIKDNDQLLTNWQSCSKHAQFSFRSLQDVHGGCWSSSPWLELSKIYAWSPKWGQSYLGTTANGCEGRENWRFSNRTNSTYTSTSIFPFGWCGLFAFTHFSSRELSV